MTRSLVHLKETTTGDTLSDPLKPVILERMEFPDPVIQIAIEPKTKGDQEKMGIALNRLAAEDPSFRVKSDDESGQTIIAGMGELHLDILVDRMKREFKVEANVGEPQVAFRETITKAYEADYTHKKQSGGSGQFARVKIMFEPNAESEEFEFDSKIVGDGAYHDVDSSVLAFEIAARACFRENKSQLGAQMLEPIMAVEVVTPEEYLGDIIGNLNSRRGMIQGQEVRGIATVVNAHVPLMNMFKYVDNLRSMSQGRAQYSMQFDHYAPVPSAVSKEIQEKFTG